MNAANVTSASREVRAAKVQLAQAEANLTYCELVMPYPEGTVAARHVETRTSASPPGRSRSRWSTCPLCELRLACPTPSSVDSLSEIWSRSPPTPFPTNGSAGIITKIAPTADAQTRTYLVEVRVMQPRGLRPGMVATVALAENETATLLPLVAVIP